MEAFKLDLSDVQWPIREYPELAPEGERKDLSLGQRVRVTAWLERDFWDKENVRGWYQEPTEPVEGVVVGIRYLRSGEYIPGRRRHSMWGDDDIAPRLEVTRTHRAVLVATGLRTKHRYALTDDVEPIEEGQSRAND